MSNDEQLSTLVDYEGHNKPKAHEAYQRWVWGIVVCDVVAVIILAALAILIGNWKEAVVVIVTGLVGIGSVNGVVLQVLIAGQMTLIMDRQESEMTRQRIATENTVGLTVKIVDEMKAQTEKSNTQIALTSGQLISMRDQTVQMITALEQTERHFQVINRPVLGVEDIQWEREKTWAGMQPDRHWRVQVVFRNFGNTPAYNVQSDGTLNMIPHVSLNDKCPEPIPSSYIAEPRAKSVVAPKAPISLIVDIKKLTERNITDLWIDPKLDGVSDLPEQLWLWFEITYTDGNNKPYFMRYHAKFNRVSFVGCAVHSDAD